MENENIHNELEDLSPLLSRHKKGKKKEVSLPANYFNSFEDRLMARIEEEEALIGTTQKQEQKKEQRGWFWAWFSMRKLAGFASIALLIGVAIFFWPKPAVEEATPLLLADLSLEETRGYVLDNIEDFSTEQIVAVIEEPIIEAIQEEVKIMEEEVVDIMPVEAKEEKEEKAAIDKALEKINAEDLLDELSEEDLEGSSYELF